MTDVGWINVELELAIWNVPSEIRGQDLLVLLAVNTFADRSSRVARCSVPVLAQRARLDQKTVRGSLERLEQLSLIALERRPGTSSLITLTLPESGSTESGRGTESGTTASGPHPYRIREGTPTGSGRRTNRNQERRPTGDFDEPPWLISAGITREEYAERKDEPGWIESVQKGAHRGAA